MGEEIREELNEEKRCNCDKKDLKRFLLTILGSFLGCLVALCLYGAAIKPQQPQIPCPCAIHKMQNHGMHEFDRQKIHHQNFHKPDMKKDFQGPQKFGKDTIPTRPEMK